MKNSKIRILFLGVFLYAGARAGLAENPSAQQDKNLRFSFVYPRAAADGKKGIFLLGRYEPSLPVVLLNGNESKYCRGRTGASRHYEDEVLELTLTPVVETTGCGATDGYSLALISPGETRYEILPLNEIRDPALIRDLDRLVRSSGLLEMLVKKNRGATYALTDLIPPPKVISMGDARIVEYRFSWAAGPRVLVLNGKISALTGQCSFPALRAFRLDGEIYIESGSSCCECGIRGSELFHITPEGAVLVYSDFSLST